MNSKLTTASTLLAFAAFVCIGQSSAIAAIAYSQDFNGYVGNQNASQADTGFAIAFGGSLPGLTAGGSNAFHGVNQGSGNWAIMFYADNTLTTSSIAANTSGLSYSVNFAYGTATYSELTQSTNNTDGLIVEILRGNNSILAQQSYLPGAWGVGNRDLSAGLLGTLSYVGDGTGDIRIFIQTINSSSTRFGGSLDNLSVTSAPEPGSLPLIGAGLAGLALLKTRRGWLSRFRRSLLM